MDVEKNVEEKVENLVYGGVERNMTVLETKYRI